MFKTGDRVKIVRTYPIDRDYQIPHEADAAMWGLVGTVVVSEFGYTDDKYVFVEPLGLFTDWPRKERFDPLLYWHFLTEELEKV
jgi:hypothetical protein